MKKLHGQDIEGLTLKLRFEKNRRLREWEYYEKDKIIREMEKKGLDTRAITGESREEHSRRLREDREECKGKQINLGANLTKSLSNKFW